jgi:flagella basal body P-ring formation protein FlgA
LLAALGACGLPGRSAAAAPDPGVAVVGLASLPAGADAGLVQQIEQLARLGARQSATPGARIEISLGRLDPRLKLAPCDKIEPYLPPGLPNWGATRIGLRCLQGDKHWNVSLPVQVKVWARALVAAGPLPTGTVLQVSQLKEAEVDLAAAPGTALRQFAGAVGRTLAHPLAMGSALREPDLKPRVWFAAGENVRLVASGPGWRVESEGYAVSAGIEGQAASVRTDAGRVIRGRPTAAHEMEVSL